MTVLGIVGCAEEKFTDYSRAQAWRTIDRLIEQYRPTLVVSGACPMGGVDKYAELRAFACRTPFKDFPPEVPQWRPRDGRKGFEARNLEIADASDVLANIVLDTYPPGFPESKKFKMCYHCRSTDHIKSGGCWTMHQAAKRGKQTQLIVIPQHDYQWE